MRQEIGVKPRAGVVGLGAVGGALKHVLEFYYDVRGYDLDGQGAWESVLDTDIVFVCVGTPGGSDRRLDCGQVTAVLRDLDREGYPNPVVIRSTLRIGFMAEATARFPRLRLVYSPEFLRERSRLQWSVCPDRIVLSGEERDIRVALGFFEWVEGADILVMDYRSAEIAKLAHNAYIATKVSFTNEIEEICQRLGADPRSVMEVVSADRRVRSPEHLRPFMGPYGGKCVPKDTVELTAAARDAVLLRAVHEVNERAKDRARADSRGDRDIAAAQSGDDVAPPKAVR